MKQETKSFYERAVHTTVDEIVASLDRALDLESLAGAAALSTFHFHRVFRGMVGETPLELHRRLRMERAAWTLLHSKLPVIEVAFDAGYETHEAFSRAFRRCYATSPSIFRQRGEVDRPATLRYRLACRCRLHYQPDENHPSTLQLIPGDSAMHVEIVARPELRAAFVEHVGPYDQIHSAFARLSQIAAPAGLFGPKAAMIAIYHDDPDGTPAHELRSAAGITVADEEQLPEVPDGLLELRLPGGPYARAVHEGPYSGLGDSWAQLMGGWLPASNERLAQDGISYELYRNTPMDAAPEDLRTEIYVPLAERARSRSSRQLQA